MIFFRMVSMTQGKWSRLSPTQRADIWIRWKAGQTLTPLTSNCRNQEITLIDWVLSGRFFASYALISELR
jgi:hypothetical protein